MAQKAENQRENHYCNIRMIMLNCTLHIQKFGRNSLSVSYPLPYPTTIGEKGDSKTTIQGWPLAMVGCFGCFWCVLSALHPDLSACVAPHHRFRVGCLPSLPRHGSTDDERTTAGAGARGRPQGWGCGGGTILAAPTYIYMNLCEREVYIF